MNAMIDIRKGPVVSTILTSASGAWEHAITKRAKRAYPNKVLNKKLIFLFQGKRLIGSKFAHLHQIIDIIKVMIVAKKTKSIIEKPSLAMTLNEELRQITDIHAMFYVKIATHLLSFDSSFSYYISGSVSLSTFSVLLILLIIMFKELFFGKKSKGFEGLRACGLKGLRAWG